MITINDKNRVSAKDLHKTLDVKTEYYHWINRSIDQADLKDGKDFTSFLRESTGGRPAKEYEFTIDAAKEVCLISATPKSKELRRWLIDLSNKAENLELITVKQAAFAVKVINCLKFIDNQKEAFNLHRQTYISEHGDSNYIYAEFNKYRAKLTGWDKERTNKAVDEFIKHNVGASKKLVRSDMQTQLSAIDIGEAIRIAVLDILYAKHESEDMAINFAKLCKNLSNEMQVTPEKTNTNSLYKEKEKLVIPVININDCKIY